MAHRRTRATTRVVSGGPTRANGTKQKKINHSPSRRASSSSSSSRVRPSSSSARQRSLGPRARDAVRTNGRALARRERTTDARARTGHSRVRACARARSSSNVARAVARHGGRTVIARRPSRALTPGATEGRHRDGGREGRTDARTTTSVRARARERDVLTRSRAVSRFTRRRGRR